MSKYNRGYFDYPNERNERRKTPLILAVLTVVLFVIGASQWPGDPGQSIVVPLVLPEPVDVTRTKMSDADFWMLAAAECVQS